MKKHTKYSHYRPMVFAGFVSGLLVTATAGALLWFIAPSKTADFSAEPESESLIKLEETAAAENIEEKPIELFFGGTELSDDFRFLALYGNPEYKSLGALGEQPLNDTYDRVKALAKQYQALTDSNVIPTLELITTIASAGPTDDDDYSQEIEADKILSWAKDAEKNDVYLVLDLQPGRATFLEQAKAYEEVLRLPNVGLALDPEWRLQKKTDRHLVKVGSVSSKEINQTSEWLANFTKDNKLPQKMFIVHQFKDSMITDREKLRTDREELLYVLHMDGHGSMGQKIETWNRLKKDLPQNMQMAWKNFYDEDKPTPTPKHTMLQDPQPVFVSYQ